MATMRNKGMSLTVWALIGVLIFGLAGFGVQGFGGSATTSATVDGRDIQANDFARALDQQMRAFSAQIGRAVTLEEAQAIGLDRSVRAELIGQALLDAEAERIGLSVGDERVAAEVLRIPAFQGLDGRFDRAAYGEALARVGATEAEFERRLREDAARGILQTAIATGAAPSPVFLDRLVSYLGETRAARYVTLTEATLPAPLPVPDEAALRAWYDSHLDDFTLPEAKRISYALATPATLAATLPIEEAALRAAYQARLADYVQPERRLVERLAFGSDADAAAARARLDAGTASFDDLLAERRLSLADIDLGDVAQSDLGAAGAAVFALAGPGVTGPLPSDFGPALYRMNGILAAQEIPFEEARPVLQEELGAEAARRVLAGRAGTITDLRAGGASVAEIAEATELEPGRLDYRPGDEEGIAGYPAVRAAAAALVQGDFPQLISLSDGGLLVMALQETVPAAPIPFDQARGSVTAAWQAAELALALTAQGDALTARLAAGEDIAALGLPVETAPALRRDSEIATLPPDFVAQVFALVAGAVARVRGDNALTLVRLDGVTAPDPQGADGAALRAAIGQQTAQSLGQDLVETFTQALQSGASISFNEATATAVLSQMRGAAGP